MASPAQQGTTIGLCSVAKTAELHACLLPGPACILVSSILCRTVLRTFLELGSSGDSPPERAAVGTATTVAQDGSAGSLRCIHQCILAAASNPVALRHQVKTDRTC